MFLTAYQSGINFFRINFDEIKFSILFISAIVVNKYVLSELLFTKPTVFQGWQTFVCVLLLSILIKFEKPSSDLKQLDRRSFYLFLPGLISFAVSIVAGSKALSQLPVPVFCAILSLNPAILILLEKKTDFSDSSKRICGSVAICGTVVVLLVMTLNKRNTEAYLWLLGHIFLGIFYIIYMEKISLDLSNTSKIYCRNFFSVVVLLPISIYLDVLHLPRDFNWRFYLGCLLSGILGTFLQITTTSMESARNFMNCQGRAKLICSIIAHNLFFANVEPEIWFLIIINLLIHSIFLSPDNYENNKKPKLTLIVGQPQARNLNIDNVVCV